MDSPDPSRSKRTAFLLAQLGALASARFAERTRELGLTPSDAGVLRLLGRTPGLASGPGRPSGGGAEPRCSPHRLAGNARPLARVRSRTDRRNYELRLTPEGTKMLGALRGIAERHEAELLASLTSEQSAQLGSLLARLASAHALDTDLHRDTSLE